MIDDPWGRDEPPAVAEADLEPLPAAMREIVEAFERGDRVPVAPTTRVDRPGARDLPEVRALAEHGWVPLPTGFGAECGLLPSVWPREHRCWVYNRVPAFGVCTYVEGETFIEPEHRNPERDHWELVRDARSHGLQAPPRGRQWLVRSPWTSLSANSLLLLIRQARDTDGLGWDAVAMTRAATRVLDLGEEEAWARWTGLQADAARAWRDRDASPAVDEWIRLGLAPDGLEVLTRPQDEGGAELPEASVVEWCEAVSLGGEPRGDLVERVVAWRGIGLPGEAPVRDLTTVMWEQQPADVAAWIAAGLSVEEIVAWEAHDLPRALLWRDAGFDARESRALTVADPGLTPDEARAFDDLGIEPAARRRWVATGFSAAEAREWTGLDVVASEARVWRSLGLDTVAGQRHRAGGGDALPPGFEGGWGAVGPGRDDVSHGVVDPPGTRGSAAETGWDGIPGDLPHDGLVG